MRQVKEFAERCSKTLNFNADTMSFGHDYAMGRANERQMAQLSEYSRGVLNGILWAAKVIDDNLKEVLKNEETR